FESALLPRAYRWQPNRTAASLAELYREQRRKSALFCADALPGRGGTEFAPPSRFAPNALGRAAIAALRARNFDQFQLRRCALETHASLVEALIGAKAYSDAEGALPERLADLLPRYLGALRLARYHGARSRYARALPAVYSVGEDFADAGPGAAPSLDDPRAPGLSLGF